MGKLDGKVAVITGATSGMALAGAKLFVDEGAHVPLDAGLLQDLQQGKRERREHDVLATANSRLARQARDLPLEALESVIKEAHYIAVGEASGGRVDARAVAAHDRPTGRYARKGLARRTRASAHRPGPRIALTRSPTGLPCRSIRRSSFRFLRSYVAGRPR